MLADLPLVDQAILVRVDILEGVLERDDVVIPRLVQVVHHGRERRRLPGVRRAGHQDQAVLPGQQLLEGFGEPQSVERRNLVGNDPEGTGQPDVFFIDVDPEPRHLGQFVHEIDFSGIFQFPDLGVRQHLGKKDLHLLGSEDPVLRRLQDPVHPKKRRIPVPEVQVGRAGLLHDFQEGIDSRHVPGPLFPDAIRIGGRTRRPGTC